MIRLRDSVSEIWGILRERKAQIVVSVFVGLASYLVSLLGHSKIAILTTFVTTIVSAIMMETTKSYIMMVIKKKQLENERHNQAVFEPYSDELASVQRRLAVITDEDYEDGWIMTNGADQAADEAARVMIDAINQPCRYWDEEPPSAEITAARAAQAMTGLAAAEDRASQIRAAGKSRSEEARQRLQVRACESEQLRRREAFLLAMLG